MVEDDVRLVLDEYKSRFITYETSPGFYNFRDNSKALLRFLQSEYQGYHNAVDIEFDDITIKTKLVVRSGIIVIRFVEKSFFVLSSVSNHFGIINTIMNTLARKL